MITGHLGTPTQKSVEDCGAGQVFNCWMQEGRCGCGWEAGERIDLWDPAKFNYLIITMRRNQICHWRSEESYVWKGN